MGDGGGVNDPFNNAQNPNSLLGKILRIDVDVLPGDPKGFRVPPDNPFVDGQPIAALPEIWSFGWRNPWGFSFDEVGPGSTGALIAGDVGEGSREEIDYEPHGAGGRNYGWRIREGTIATPGAPPTEPAYLPLTDPIYDYPHPEGFAVIGGYVYRGSCLPSSFRGRYFFADHLTARVWSMGLAIDPFTGEARFADLQEHTTELGGPGRFGRITSFGRDIKGELYVTASSGIWKISAGSQIANRPCEVQAVVSVRDVLLSWDAAEGATHYLIEAGTAPGAGDLGAALSSDTSVFVPAVPVATYYVRVRGLGFDGLSEPTADTEVVVSGACESPPPPATNVHILKSSGTVTFSWSIDGTPDGPTALSIEAGRSPGAIDIGAIPLSPQARAITAREPSGTYFVRIRTTNACGTTVSTEFELF